MRSIKLLAFLLLIGLISCEKASDSVDIEPILEESELSADAHIVFFNSLSDVDNIDIKINASEEKIALPKARLSEYFLVGKGQHDIVIKNADSGETLLSKTISLDGGQYYSSYLYKNRENEIDLLVSEDYSQFFRENGSLTSALELVVVNLSSNIPFDSLDIVNSHTYITANCGTDEPHCTIKCHDIKDQWVDGLAFGASQRVRHAPLSITSNHIQFLSSASADMEVLVEGFNASPRPIAIDPTGSGTLQNIERFNNLSNRLDKDLLYLFILEDAPENEGVKARFLELNTKPISSVSFQ